ncbi:alpha/beta hydrolase [Novosphingobium sp. JCM 18896]|uniref:alpha/beta hydrolase n=1 Tax=Novosphingobium sp. JCM 18896 TaxID=2989731 RepID=UPI0029CA2FFA|nr:alpha/beta hydrolase [Novosphingobium sp. JCM 18896]
MPTSIVVGGREALLFEAADVPSRATLLHLHGGGFRQGAPEISSAFAEALVRRCGLSVYALRYRLAPEHPFPAGLSDAWSALEALRQLHGDRPLIVCGDSAGGGLAAGLAAINGSREDMLIDGLVMLSPWLDLTVSAPTYRSNAASDPLFSADTAETAALLYLQGTPADHPLASPLHASVHGFPPTLIVTGRGEVLLEDSIRMDARLRAEGVQSTLEVIAGMDHVAVTRGLTLPGAAQCLDHVTHFIDRLIDTINAAPRGAHFS